MGLELEMIWYLSKTTQPDFVREPHGLSDFARQKSRQTSQNFSKPKALPDASRYQSIRTQKAALGNDLLMIDEFAKHPTNKRRQAGNTIFEYLLPAGLILGISIGALTLFGSGLNGQFGALDNHMKSKVSNTQQQVQLQQIKKDAFAAAATTPKPGAKGGGGSGAGSLPSGVSLTDISSTIQTAGANGGTEVLASALQNYIQKLKAEGNLTPDQVNLLTQLANAGHNLAGAEKALDDAVKGGQGSVTYNGQTYSVADFQAQFGFNNNVGIDASKTMDAGSAMPQLAPFMNLYQQAQASGALSDPAVEGQVTYLSKQIAALSDLAKWNTTSSATDLSYGYVTAMQQVGIPNAPPSISDATHTDSSGICGSGGSGTDSGTACN